MTTGAFETSQRTSILNPSLSLPKSAALLVLPLLVLFATFHLRTISGPYYLSENLDPSYLYLLNSLNIATLHRPAYTDHPGTPIETVGGITLAALNLGKGRAATARNVLQDPERYLRFINGEFVLFHGFVLLLAGYICLIATRSLLFSLLVQSTPFISKTTMQGLTGLRPEPLMVSLSILVVALTVLAFRYDIERYALRFALGFGLVCGLGMASKINFLPVLLIPLLVLPRWKWRIMFGAITAIAFLIAILPILTPWHLHNMFGFLFGVTTHTGRYGAGAAGFIDPQRFILSAENLVKGEILFFLLSAISFVFLLFRQRFDSLKGIRLRALLAVCVAEILQTLMVAKHPHSRYMVPALALAGLNLAIIGEAVLPKFSTSVRVPAIVVAGLLLFAVEVSSLRALNRKVGAMTARQITARALLDQNFKDAVVVDYYSASSVPYALKFGSGYSGNLFDETLRELYPNSYFYNLWDGQFSTFNGPATLKAVAGTRGWFIMHGYPLNDSDFKIFLPEKPLPDGVQLEAVFGANSDLPGEYDGEAIYLARVPELH